MGGVSGGGCLGGMSPYMKKTLCRWFIAHNTKCCYFVLIKVVSRWKRFTCCVGYVRTGHIKSLVFSVYWGYVLIGRNYENKIIVTLTLIFTLERTGGNQCRGFASIPWGYVTNLYPIKLGHNRCRYCPHQWKLNNWYGNQGTNFS